MSPLVQNGPDRASDLTWLRSRIRTNTFPLDISYGSNEAGRNGPNFWNWRRSGGLSKRKGKNMRPRKESGSRRGVLGRLGKRQMKKRIRRGYTSKKSSLHGSDGKARRSRSAPRKSIPRRSNFKTVGCKQATRVLRMTHFGDRAWMDLPW